MRVVTFADFDEHKRPGSWHEVVVRFLSADDVSSVAAIFAERESVSLSQAIEVVSQWAPATLGCFALVAERHGRIDGYAKAEWLSPHEHGGNAPAGWYLTGLVVKPSARRHGLGARLTQERIALLKGRASAVWYFANVRNRVTIALHEKEGFEFQAQDFAIPGVTFDGGEGALFRLVME